MANYAELQHASTGVCACACVFIVCAFANEIFTDINAFRNAYGFKSIHAEAPAHFTYQQNKSERRKLEMM